MKGFLIKLFKDKVANNFCDENRRSFSEDVSVGVCSWCGSKFVKSKDRKSYCSDFCRDNARAEQSRLKSNKWYHRHKHELSEEQRWGLGSGFLSGHRNGDFVKEQSIVARELVRLKLRRD